ncbi:MAG: hypothetical protein ABJA82_14580 [Myxococcales bacterium]
MMWRLGLKVGGFGRFRTTGLIGLLVLGATTPAVQARPGTKARPAVVAEGADGAGEAPHTLFEAPVQADPGGTREPQNLNPPEMLSLVKQYSTEIRRALVVGERRREEAVGQRDSIRLACIQDHLTNMKLMKMLADSRLESTERALVRADELSLRHEFRGVEMAHERVLKLEAALKECAGENLDIASGNSVSTPPGPSNAGVNPADTDVAVVPPIDRPAPASAYE